MTAPVPLRSGTPVGERMTKWDGSAHWTSQMFYLGEDEYGVWLGSPPGIIVSRPGASFVAADYCAKLLPREGWSVPNVNGPRGPFAVYVDIATPPTLEWSDDPRDPGWLQHAIDLDLDVLRRHDGVVAVDDEDEFAAHRRSYGYPAEVVEAAEHSCAVVLAALRSGAEPYGAVGEAWLRQATEVLEPV